MPAAMINGTNLYYEVHGDGEPLVLIQGFAGGTQAWGLQVRAFKKYFRVITFDNRGAGRTGPSKELPTIEMMADDVIALLNHLGISNSHILGLSMGGMIAQEIAISYPQRVNKLILCSTFAERDLPGTGAQPQATDIRNMDFDALMERMISLSYNIPFYRALFIALMKINRKAIDSKGIFDQAQALSTHSTLDRLRLIKSPTLVMTGTGDRLVSPRHSDILAGEISGAKLVKVRSGSHAFFFEKAGIFNREVLAFLKGG
jgi:pimeloyl-ACP methyl ester carboxylesterase